MEVGLQYFGKRFLNPLLGRWVSADPLAVHAPGQADLNVYAYVSGTVLKNVDPLGLEQAAAPNGAPLPWDTDSEYLSDPEFRQEFAPNAAQEKGIESDVAATVDAGRGLLMTADKLEELGNALDSDALRNLAAGARNLGKSWTDEEGVRERLTGQVTMENFRNEASSYEKIAQGGANLDYVHPWMRWRVITGIARYIDGHPGYEIRPNQTYRSPAGQAAAKSGGASGAAPGRSCHQHGCAVDILIRKNGGEWDKGVSGQYGELANGMRSMALRWAPDIAQQMKRDNPALLSTPQGQRNYNILMSDQGHFSFTGSPPAIRDTITPRTGQGRDLYTGQCIAGTGCN